MIKKIVLTIFLIFVLLIGAWKPFISALLLCCISAFLVWRKITPMEFIEQATDDDIYEILSISDDIIEGWEGYDDEEEEMLCDICGMPFQNCSCVSLGDGEFVFKDGELDESVSHKTERCPQCGLKWENCSCLYDD